MPWMGTRSCGNAPEEPVAGMKAQSGFHPFRKGGFVDRHPPLARNAAATHGSVL